MKEHILKIWPKFFKDILSLEKTFEVRKNDREFEVGDTLILKEFDPETESYSGDFIYVEITYLTPLPGIPGFVGMSIDLA